MRWQRRWAKRLESRAEQRPRKPVKEEKGGAEEGRKKVGEVSQCTCVKFREDGKSDRVYYHQDREGKKMLRCAHLVSQEVTLGVSQVCKCMWRAGTEGQAAR